MGKNINTNINTHTSIISFYKIKNTNAGKYSLSSAYDHNERLVEVTNADPDKKNLNKELVPLKEKNYLDAYDKEIDKILSSGIMKTIRKDAIRGIEVVAPFNKPETDYSQKDLDDWCKDTINWIKENFGENNVKHAVLHMDENTPHIHVVIIPIDEKGHLNAHRFLAGKGDFIRKQTDFAEKVGNKYGLKRGVPMSERTKKKYNNYKTMAKFKEATIGKALADIDDIKPRDDELDELGHIIPEHYLKRLEDAWESKDLMVLAAQNNIDKEISDIEEIMLRQQNDWRKEMKKKMDKASEVLGIAKEKIINGEFTPNELKKFFKTYDTLCRAINNDNYPDKEEQKQIAKSIDKLIEWQRNIDKKEIEEKEKNKEIADNLFKDI